MAVQAVLPQIAEKYGVTVKTVTRRIREHPELGIVIQPKKAPVLDQNQVQQLCAILDAEYGRHVKLGTERDVTAMRTDMEYADLAQRFEEMSKRVSELERTNAQLKTDLAVANARIDEKDKYLDIVQDQARQVPLLQEAAQERIREIESLRGDLANAKMETAAARDEWKQKGFFDRMLRR